LFPVDLPARSPLPDDSTPRSEVLCVNFTMESLLLLKELKNFAISLYFLLLSCFSSMIIVDMSARTHLALGVGELSAAVFRGYFYILGALLQDWIDFV
jgi:hypothetical protein